MGRIRLKGKRLRKANEGRADGATEAVEAYGRYWTIDGSLPVPEDRDTVFQDLLNDLMHYAKRWGIDFDEAVRMGRGNFDEEDAGIEM